jgi:hypothetical protein
VPLPASFDARRGRRELSLKTRSADRVTFGEVEVELGAVEQIVEQAQTRAMARALARARGRIFDGRCELVEGLERIVEEIEREGLEVLEGPPPGGEHAAFRIHELAAFANRLRSLRIS